MALQLVAGQGLGVVFGLVGGACMHNLWAGPVGGQPPPSCLGPPTGLVIVNPFKPTFQKALCVLAQDILNTMDPSAQVLYKLPFMPGRKIPTPVAPVTAQYNQYYQYQPHDVRQQHEHEQQSEFHRTAFSVL